MIDTNQLNEIAARLQAAQAAAPAVQSALNSWYLVALGILAVIVHAYHVIVQAGGMENIWKAFWKGPQKP